MGYYHLGPTRAPGSISMLDLRDYSAAAVAYYDGAGALVEHLYDDFLATVESTTTPVPVVMSEVASPAALVAATQSQMLTHVRGRGAPHVFEDGLQWNSQYAANPVFVAHKLGPQIECWPQTRRTYTLGAERFVTGSALLQAGIQVRAGKANLAEIRISNGRELFRRFDADAATSFERTLLLDGCVIGGRFFAYEYMKLLSHIYIFLCTAIWRVCERDPV